MQDEQAMDRRRIPSDEVEAAPSETEARTPNDETEAPAPREQDWDAVRGARILPDGVPEESVPENAGIEKDGELPEEDDDNPYQDSEEALPDDAKEAAISRDPARRGGPFDVV